MTKPPKSSKNSPDNRDEWESLAADLFGVDFHKSTPQPVEGDFDDLDDLLEDLPIPPRAPESAQEPQSVAEVSGDLLDESTSEDSVSDVDRVDDPVVDDADLDSFSFEDEDEDEDEEDAFEEVDDEDDDEIPRVESSEECELLVSETKPSIPPDDFWAALDRFTPEELTSHDSAPRGKTRGSDRPRGPERGKKSAPRPTASAPVTNVPIIRNEFVENDEFGLGVLEDIEVDSDDEDSATGASGAAAGEGGDGEQPKRRRSRRRRRGRRKPKPETASSTGELAAESAVDDEEESVDSDDSGDVTFEESVAETKTGLPSRPAVVANRQEDDDEENEDDFDEDGVEDEDGVDDEDRDEQPRYKNVPTWAQAISYLKRRTDAPRSSSPAASSKSDSPAAGEREKKGSGRRRSRGSGRRRRKPEAPKSSPPAAE